jgi:predicted TIM-barrel fold metal-dependent hydrolase
VSVLDEPKIDGHCHVLDPEAFPYTPDTAYRPAGQEMGTLHALRSVMDCYRVQHALLVGPNSGYGLDNRCLLNAIATSEGRFKGIAVVPNDTQEERLLELKAQGVVGLAFNAALQGLAYYADLLPLLKRLAKLEMWAQFQVEGDQLVALRPMMEQGGARILIDHCGRPIVAHGVAQPGFQALLEMGRQKQAVVKLSGQAKYSQTGYPFDDVRPYMELLFQNFGPEHCIWASDWPYLKAPYRLDFGPMLRLMEQTFSASERRAVMWDTPRRLFGFSQTT